MSEHELPTGWSWSRFSEVARIAARLVDPAGLSNLPHIAPDNIERETGRLLPYRTVGEDGMKSAKHRFYSGQLLYSKIRPYLNKCVRVDFDGLCSADMYPLDAFVDPRFLHQYILTRQFVSAVSEAAGSRTVLPKTNQKQLADVPVPIAPEVEQHRIVAAMESYFTRLDDAVATLERVERNLKRYRASVLKAAVEGRLVPTEAELARAEGRSYEPASVLLTRILAERRRRWEEAELARMTAKGKTPKDDKWKTKYVVPVAPDTSELPELPEGWCWASVDQIERGDRRSAYGVLVPGPDVADGVPFVRVGDIDRGRVDVGQMKRIARNVADRFGKTYLEGGEVLLTLVGTIGRTAVAPPTLAGANVARAVGVIPATDLVDHHWIERWFRSPVVRHRMIGKAHEVARKTLNLEDVRTAPVALPPRAEQSRVVEAVDDHESIIDSSREATDASIQRLARLRQSILKWAFEGRLVDQDPTDEPASVLLERIRAEREGSARAATEGRGRNRRTRAQ